MKKRNQQNGAALDAWRAEVQQVMESQGLPLRKAQAVVKERKEAVKAAAQAANSMKPEDVVALADRRCGDLRNRLEDLSRETALVNAELAHWEAISVAAPKPQRERASKTPVPVQ